MLPDYQMIEKVWGLSHVKSISPFGDGHINDTYRFSASSGNYILQRVNKHVFDIRALVNNYEVFAGGVKNYQKTTGEKLTPGIYKTLSGSYHYIDKEGFAWRLVECIENAKTYQFSPDTAVSRNAAGTVAGYQLFLNTIDPELIRDTIPRFHNLPKRFEIFNASCESADNVLKKQAIKEILAIRERSFIVDRIAGLVGKLPRRIIHNDTKLENIIFKGNHGLMIDLDTVMQGFTMYDFGDMVRTFTCEAAEDEQDLKKVVFRSAHFDALTHGYLEKLKTVLTTEEKDSLLTGALCILYEQAIRFLTDYLQGNHYYKVNYPTHNLIRTRTQLKLLEALLKDEKRLMEIIRRYS